MWGYSSAGRAPALHAGGQEFEPPHLHQYKKMYNREMGRARIEPKFNHAKKLSNPILSMR